MYNVYGPEGVKNDGNKKSYYFGIEIADGKIFASYINDLAVVNDGTRLKGNIPSKLLIFNTQGDYLFTIETEDKFSYFCVDEDNNRMEEEKLWDILIYLLSTEVLNMESIKHK